MDDPLFKSSDGGRVDILRVWEDITESKVRQVSGLDVRIGRKVYPAASPIRRRGKESLLIRRDATPEACPTGSPMSVGPAGRFAGWIFWVNLWTLEPSPFFVIEEGSSEAVR